MAIKTLSGNGQVASADFHAVKWTGKTKSGSPVVITLSNALNMSDIDLTMAEKDDMVSTVTFTACYTNTDAASSSDDEPWTISLDDSLSGASSIVLGVGVFSIDGEDVALTRGGGSFKVTREFRQINADGDRGPVKDRVRIEGATAELTLNALTWLSSATDLWAGVSLSS